jgi:hypothetical protein
MSVLEPCQEPKIVELLAGLEVRLDAEAAIATLPLTRALEQCLLFAQAHNLSALSQFINQELSGYTSQPPSYRHVRLSYFDNGGQYVDGLEQYRSYPIVTGVYKLETHLKNGMSLMLPKQILDFLSQTAKRQIDMGHISHSEVEQLLEAIRNEAICRLTEIVD